MIEHAPVTTYGDLLTLNEDEIVEGYRDGRAGGPCGDNRSRSYWHGWRNGRVDSGFDTKTDDMALLAADYRRMEAFARMPVRGRA